MKKEDLKKKIEEIEITYDYEQTYCDLRNAVIDYENETQDWSLDYAFDEFIDEELLKDLVKYKIDEEGLWSVVNLLDDISNYDGIYRIDAYGYGHDIDKDDLETLKEDILDRIGDEE